MDQQIFVRTRVCPREIGYKTLKVLHKNILGIIWASPISLLALGLGILGTFRGTKVQRRGQVIEFYGGPISRFLEWSVVDAAAMTLGHVIYGRCPATLDFCREHELVHVRQFERWGIFFLPAYLLFSLVLYFRGRHPYYDNPFEREAFHGDHPYYRQQSSKSP